MTKRHTIDSVFTLVLFTLFAITALFITAAGALAYKNTAHVSEERFNRQTCLNYITAKIHANNDTGKISVSEFSGESALCITENINGTEYGTYIYWYDGAVRELFCDKSLGLGADAGSEIAEADGLSFMLDENLISIQFTDTAGNALTACANILE